MSLSAIMREHLDAHPRMSDKRLAATFLQEYTGPALASLLTAEFQHIRRAGVRGVEKTIDLTSIVASRKGGKALTAAAVRAALGDLGKLLDQPYRIGDGVERVARDMTVQDWKNRRAMLIAHREGLERGIAVCDAAIDALTRAGVETLGDLDGGMAKAA